MKRAIKTWILKNYPPIVMSVVIAIGLFLFAMLFGFIEQFFTPNLPPHLR